MSRYIDADALEDKAKQYSLGYYEEDEWAVPFKEITSAPSIDIVFCKECKWADWYKTADGKQFCYCMETGNGGRTADDYCSYGERKESE